MELAARPGHLPATGQDRTPPRTSEAFWGYIIHQDADRLEHEPLSGAALRFAGLILVLSAYGQWLLPSALFPEGALYDKSALSFLLGAAGVAVYWAASRGARAEVQVDLIRRQLRLARRGGRGHSQVLKVIPMSKVESAYIARRKDGEGPTQLFLRLRDRDEALHVATGEESELLVLHRRLSHDLRPVEERINHRLARSVAFRSSRAV